MTLPDARSLPHGLAQLPEKLVRGRSSQPRVVRRGSWRVKTRRRGESIERLFVEIGIKSPRVLWCDFHRSEKNYFSRLQACDVFTARVITHPNRHDTGSTTARSVDEVALIRDTISHYVPVLSAPLSNPSRRRVGNFF
jgi:hypothetical protein